MPVLPPLVIEYGPPEQAAMDPRFRDAFAGVSASVMLPCQEGESPSDVKS